MLYNNELEVKHPDYVLRCSGRRLRMKDWIGLPPRQITLLTGTTHITNELRVPLPISISKYLQPN